MKYNKDKNQFPKLGFGIFLWVVLLYASLGQASETADKPSETAELKEQKSEVTKPVPGSLQDFDILHINNIFDPNRKPYQPDRKRQEPEPEPQIDAFTVIGLMAYADRQIAVLSGLSLIHI